MKFETAKKVVKGTLVIGLACCILAMIVQTNGSELGTYLTVAGIGCIIVCLFTVATGMKCPYCGEHIIKKCLVVTSCPHCHRNLSTGIKGKGKKK